MIYYVSNEGYDHWSGQLPEPNQARTDGPLASPDRAKELIREYKLTNKEEMTYTVVLRGGKYVVTEPITFDERDSGAIWYKAYPNEIPVIDGGRVLSGWQEEALGSLKVWTLELPKVKNGSWYFNQLFVNDERRNRPRLPKKGLYEIADVPGMTFEDPIVAGSNTFKFKQGDIQTWKNLQDVHIVVPHFWTDEHMPISSVDTERNLVSSSRTSIFVLKDDFIPKYAKYYVDNIFEALTEPGEWYLDRADGKLYYAPMEGEVMEACTIIAPMARQLVKLVGKPEADLYVEGITFSGIHFRHTDWILPSGGGERFGNPGIDYATAPQAAINVPGVIYMEGSRQITIEQCTIANIGWYGIELSEGCSDIRIIHNQLRDLGAGGIKIDGVDVDGAVCRRTGNNVITDNVICSGGRVFHSAIGVVLTHSFGNEVCHNRIHDFYYSGISSGWVWGYGPSISMNNRFEYNHIYNLGHGLLSDMGGIYLLGAQPGTVIRHNVIHDIEKSNYGGWGIYMDEGSSYVLIENNICYHTSSQSFHQHYGRENMVRNNIFAFGGEGPVALTRGEEHNSFTFMRNIVISKGKPMIGVRKERIKSLISEANLFWDVSMPVQSAGEFRYEDGCIQFDQIMDITEWRKHMGNDYLSVIADPQFCDLDNLNFELAPDSPAFQIGFKPIAITHVGPRNPL
jgi:hypothetical protein